MGWEYQSWLEPPTLYQSTRTTSAEISWSSYAAHAAIRSSIAAGSSITAATMDSINYLTSTFTYHQHTMYDLVNITSGGYDNLPYTQTEHYENTGYPFNGAGYMYAYVISNPCVQNAPITTASVNTLAARVAQVRAHHSHYWYDDSY